MKPALRVATLTVAISAALWAGLRMQRIGIESPFEVTIFQHLVLYQDYYSFLPFVLVLLLALWPPLGRLGLGVASFCGRHPWRVAGCAVLALCAATRWVYFFYPLSMDEYTVLFQSKIFAAGHLTGQFPPELVDWLIPKGIQGKFFKVSLDTGKVASAYWPGFSLLLTPFSALGLPWLLNPLIAGATLLVMHRLGLVLFGRAEAAGFVVLLTLASPAFTINAISYYSMPAHLLANAVYMLLLLAPSPRRAACAGLVGSVALVLHNPVPHLLFALPWVVWLAFQPGRRKLIAWLVAGYLPVCIAIGFGWAMFLDRLSGGPASALGGAKGALLGRLGTIVDWAWEPSLAMHFDDLAKLWIWAVPGLLTLAGMAAWRMRRERGRWVAMAASALGTYVAYLYIPFDQGHGWGYRYFHSAWAVLPLFATAALYRTVDERAPDAPAGAGPSLGAYAAACALLSLTLLTTSQALQVRHFISRHLAQRPSSAHGDVRLVIIDPRRGYYAWDLVQNDPFLRGHVVTLLSLRPEWDRAMVARRFPQYRLLASPPNGSVWGLPGAR